MECLDTESVFMDICEDYHCALVAEHLHLHFSSLISFRGGNTEAFHGLSLVLGNSSLRVGILIYLVTSENSLHQ